MVDTIAPEDRLTVDEAAARFDIRADSVYRQLRQGTFPCLALKIGGRWAISRTSVDDWLREADL